MSKRNINEAIKLLERVTGMKVLLENDEASKNIAVESLKAINETLDMLKQNIMMANEKLGNLAGQDIAKQKLRGLESIIDTSITDVSQLIAGITGMETEQDMIAPATSQPTQDGILPEADDKGIAMSMDQASKNIQDVKKFAEDGVNIILKDDKY